MTPLDPIAWDAARKAVFELSNFSEEIAEIAIEKYIASLEQRGLKATPELATPEMVLAVMPDQPHLRGKDLAQHIRNRTAFQNAWTIMWRAFTPQPGETK